MRVGFGSSRPLNRCCRCPPAIHFQVIKSFPEMEAELDRQSNEKEAHLKSIVPKRDTKLKRMYANPSKDKVIAATMIQVRDCLARGHSWCSQPQRAVRVGLEV